MDFKLNFQFNYKDFKTEKERAHNMLRFLERYSKNNNGRAFKKNEAVQYLEEQIGENKEFIDDCIEQLKKNGILYEPDHVLQFSKKLKKLNSNKSTYHGYEKF